MPRSVENALFSLDVGLKNKTTTILGFLLAVAFYIQTVGWTTPPFEFTREAMDLWIRALSAMLIQVFGIYAKDATTGSVPRK